MSRATNAPASRERRRKRLELAKGFRGRRSKTFRTATEAVDRARRLATIHRKLKKRDFRQLWIARINAATRAEGMSYSAFIAGLTKANVTINRKMLSEIAIGLRPLRKLTHANAANAAVTSRRHLCYNVRNHSPACAYSGWSFHGKGHKERTLKWASRQQT